jgi:hypothetical protein
MDGSGVCQPRRPGVEFLAVRDSERQMVQAGARLVERVLTPVPVLGEPQASLQAVVSSPGQPVAGGSDTAPGLEPEGRLPLDHLIKRSHPTERAARRIMGDLRPGRMVARPAGELIGALLVRTTRGMSARGDEPRWVA